MALLGKWSGGVNAVTGNAPESWAAPNGMFPSQVVNDSNVYSFNSSNSTLTLPANNLAKGYLIVGHYQYHDTSNGRFSPQGRIIQSSGTGDFVGGPSGGYNRDNSEDRSYVRCFAFVNNPSPSSTFQFQWKADTDDATGGTEQSELQVIPFSDYSNYGIYTSSNSDLLGGTVPNIVPGWSSVAQSDANAIELVGNTVTFKGDNKKGLILGSQFFEGRGGRTQRWHGLSIDGSLEHAAKAYSYYRSGSDDESGDIFTWPIQTTSNNITIEQICYRGDGVSNGQGGAGIDATNPNFGDHAIVVLELNDSAEIFRCTGNLNQNIATTGPVDVTLPLDFNDSEMFTAGGSVNCVRAADVLLGANISAASESVGSGQRFTGFAQHTLNGVEDLTSQAGDYLRGNQGTADTFGWSANTLGFLRVAANDDVGVSCTELPGSEGHAGRVHIQVGWAGFWGVNLDSLQDAPQPGGLINVYNGTVFEEKPIRVWNGSAWEQKPIRYWDGAAWIET